MLNCWALSLIISAQFDNSHQNMLTSKFSLGAKFNQCKLKFGRISVRLTEMRNRMISRRLATLEENAAKVCFGKFAF